MLEFAIYAISCFVLKAYLAGLFVNDVNTFVQVLQELVIASPLNFRVNEDNHVARLAVNERKIQHLLQFDELSQLRHAAHQVSAGMAENMSESVRAALSEEQIISDFHEGDIMFAPTYKFDVGT